VLSFLLRLPARERANDHRGERRSIPHRLSAVCGLSRTLEAVPQELLHGKQSPYLRFKMPTFCAVCGVEGAKYTRKIHGVHEDRSRSSGGGILSEIASEALNSAQADLGMGGPSSGRPQIDQSRSARTYRYNKYLRNLEVPVCGPHRENKFEPGENVIADCDGDLGFASYRYYKAFCKLNGIAPPRDQA
jgi:hypothetical protein